MAEVFQLPQYRINIKNTFLEASIDNSSDCDDDDFNFDVCEGIRRQVSDPPPSTNTRKYLLERKTMEKIDYTYTNGADEVPKVSEPFEPELEPDLRQPLAMAAMIRQVTESNWSTWKTRQWEPDMELDIASRKTSTSSHSWADITDGVHNAECKSKEKEATALSGSLGMTTDTDLAPNTNLDNMVVHGIVTSAPPGGTFGQQQNAPENLDAKAKPERRRKRESLIDTAARRLQKEQRQKKREAFKNPRANKMTPNPRAPMFCSQCGGQRSQHHNFCMYCGAANS